MSAWEAYYLEYSPYPLAGTVTLNPNPYFEPPLGATGWQGVNGATIAASTAQFHEGATSLLITPDGVSAVPQVQSDLIPVTAGVPYTLHAWLRSATSDTRVAAVFWFDSSVTFVSSSQISTALSPGVWTEYGPTEYRAPVTGYARLVTNDPGTPAASHSWRVDEFTLTAQAAALPSDWRDLTARVRGPITITLGTPDVGSAAGTARPATLSATLENNDHALTFGNTASPLTGWKPGRRVRCYEVIGNRRVDLFAGYLQPPETDDWAEKNIDQFVTITAVDRLGRLGTSRTFVSTVAEHVLYNAGDALRLYYPLGDMGGGPYRPLVGAATFPPLTETLVVAAGGDPAQNNYRAASAPIGGDDLPVASFAPQSQVGSPHVPLAQTELTATFGAGIVTTGPNITVSCWVSPSVTSVDYQWRPVQIGFGTGLGGGYIRLRRTDTSETPASVWKASFIDDLSAAWSAQAYSIGAANVPTLLACRINLAANTMQLFVNGVSFAATVTGTMPSSMLLLSAILGDGYAGTLGHLQVYDSTATADHTLAAHQAQYAVGITGMAGQTTGQRITTLARYAGIPTTDLSFIDPGIAYMQKATLAGQTPLAEMAVAETTEQGRLRTNGQGLLVFDPRTRRYNS